ncbi:MAG TPA: beta-propeller domain-containing protein, partial [Candidatus Nanoarchaeia archaeon]|nr:beta-propeller domain-containing protein [Candidatus Nanoarchaeia archaeon]
MARENTQFLYLISSMIVLILIIGCAPSAPAKSPGYSTTGQSLDGPEFKKAESKSQLIAFLRQSEQSQNIANYGGARREVAVMAFDADVPLGAPQAKSAVMSEESSAGNDGAGSYSSTNIQVAGVDEADFVKNDGKYIYTIVQDSVVIVEAYPSNEAKIVSQIKLNGTPQQMFLNGDRLAVFLSGWEEVPIIAQYDFMPRPAAKSLTHALIYDVSDRSDPELIKDYDIKGNYYGSRMIGGIAYLIVQDYVYYADSYLDTPVLRESGKIVFAPDIYYPTVPSQNYNFNTIMSIDLSDDGAAPSAKTFMTGYSSTLYVSQDAIYLSSPKEQSYGYYEEEQKARFFEVVVPHLPQTARNEINAIKDDDSLEPSAQWEAIAAVLESVYNSMQEEEKQALMKDIEESLSDYDTAKEEERRRTVIHKISIEDGSIEYEAKGEVKGYLLNQFSLDEHNGNLRVATTMETWTSQEYVQYNNVYVLDEDMNQIGSLEKIAPDERIYSARFMGDRLYMVTFKRIDPFFVIDLSGNDPKILGELKLPGYSDYLHPYDENHIIGIGKETGENEWGGV